VWGINFMTHSQLVGGDFLSRNMGGTATSQSVCIQNAAKTLMTFKALGNLTTGIYATGAAVQYITFMAPTNNIYI
jgi:hypothetical protein